MALNLGLGLAPKKGVGVSLPSFMAGQTDGLWYDFSKTDRLFQEDVGQTPANDPNEVIGLAIDQRTWAGRNLSQIAAASPNLAPPFVPGGTGWTPINTDATHVLTFGAGSLRYQSDTTTPAMNISVFGALVVGRVYEMTVTCTSWTSGTLKSDSLGGVNVASGVGTQTFYGVAASSTLSVTRQGANVDLTIGNISIREVSRGYARQTTAGFKPKFQTAGATFDNTDDNLLTAYVAQNGANFIVGYLDVPATLAATQVICGASGASANRCFLAINTSGQLCAGVGSDSTATIVGTTDWRSQTVVVGLSFDGSTVKLFAGTAEEYSAAQNSTPTTSIPFRVGALNNNGTAGSFSSLAIKRLLVGTQALTLAQFKSIRTQLIAGA